MNSVKCLKIQSIYLQQAIKQHRYSFAYFSWNRQSQPQSFRCFQLPACTTVWCLWDNRLNKPRAWTFVCNWLHYSQFQCSLDLGITFFLRSFTMMWILLFVNSFLVGTWNHGGVNSGNLRWNLSKEKFEHICTRLNTFESQLNFSRLCVWSAIYLMIMLV